MTYWHTSFTFDWNLEQGPTEISGSTFETNKKNHKVDWIVRSSTLLIFVFMKNSYWIQWKVTP